MVPNYAQVPDHGVIESFLLAFEHLKLLLEYSMTTQEDGKLVFGSVLHTDLTCNGEFTPAQSWN